jgi:hypothetical protein
MLRSCYAADMQFFHDSPATLPVVWYFVPDDREALPFATVFASRIYERKEYEQLPIGEMYAPVPWRGGQAPTMVAKCGKCGDKTAWLKGVSINDPLPETYPGTDIPICCCPPDPQFIGEAASGGIWSDPFSGEAAAGGVTFEPATGEAASGGTFGVEPVFAGEAGDGGFIIEPIMGEAAAGGDMTWAYGFPGEAASGGLGSDEGGGLESGGAAAGGVVSYHGPAPAVVVACSGLLIPKALTCGLSGSTGTCGCVNGTSFALPWSSGTSWVTTATICGRSWTVSAGCSGTTWFVGGSSVGIGGGSFSGTVTGTGGVGTTVLTGTMTAAGTWCAGTFTLTLTG